MKQRQLFEPISFTIERGGETYGATYVVSGGRVTVAYISQNGRRSEKTAPVGVDALTTARMLLRELIVDLATRKK